MTDGPRAPSIAPTAGSGDDTVSLCRQWTLVKNLDVARYAKPLPCRSWTCDHCAPKRRAQLMARAAAGQPTRFVTLTVNPETYDSPESRLLHLANAWRTVVKRIRRLHPDSEVEYLAIVEQTKAGEPHLHILLRSPFIPRNWLGQAMYDLINAPIVDIRLIRDPRHVIRYVAKYVTKAPARLGTCKRYWTSQSWEGPRSEPGEKDPSIGPGWILDQRPIRDIITEWLWEGYAPRRHREETLIGIFCGRNAWDRFYDSYRGQSP